MESQNKNQKPESKKTHSQEAIEDLEIFLFLLTARKMREGTYKR